VLPTSPVRRVILTARSFGFRAAEASSSPFTADESKRLGAKYFTSEQELRPASSKTLGIKTSDQAQSGKRYIALVEN